MPVLILLLLLADLLSVALIVVDIHFFGEWYFYRHTIYDGYAIHCLYAAIAITAYLLFGKLPFPWMLSKSRKDEKKPKMEQLPSQKLQRPDGTVINIEYTGNAAGEPILFVHGWNENTNAWYYQKDYFAATHRLILIDLPGLGKSKGPSNKDYSLGKMAADLQAVIQHLNLSKVILWGHSIGGMVILTYCAKYKREDSIKGIILQHTTYTDPTKTSILSGLMTALEKPVLVPICWLMIALWPIFWLSKWLSYFNGNMLISTRFLTFAGTQTHQQLDFISRLSALARPNVFARGMLAMMRTYDVTNDLKDIDLPTLILGAKSDRLTKVTASRFMHESIRRSELVVLSPAGHQGLVERNKETNEAATAFIKRCAVPDLGGGRASSGPTSYIQNS